MNLGHIGETDNAIYNNQCDQLCDLHDHHRLIMAVEPAPAQTTAAAADADAAGALTEIVVTATKRAESIQAVPISVAVVSQAQLTEQNVLDSSDLGRVTPSVGFNQVFIAAGNAFSVRGVGSLAGGAAVDQSVGVAFDGVPLGSAAGNISDLVDMQRVEVLKGPQGMLFGKNSSAGLINLVSNAPGSWRDRDRRPRLIWHIER